MFLVAHRVRRAVTLVEVVVVMGIVVGTLTVIVPVLLDARESARQHSCMANLRQLTKGLLQYEVARGTLPPGGLIEPMQANCRPGCFTSFSCLPIDEPTFGSWIVLTLPYFGEQALFDMFDFSLPVRKQPLNPQAQTPQSLVCPAMLPQNPNYSGQGTGGRIPAGYGRGNYASFVSPMHVDHQMWIPGALGGFVPSATKGQPLSAISDGLSNSLAVTEVRPGPQHWDQRGVWSLPYPGSTLLSALVLHDFQPGEDPNDVRTIRQYTPNPEQFDQAQFPNTVKNPGIGDGLFVCRTPQVMRTVFGMPCIRLASSYMSAAPRSLHVGGVNATSLDGSSMFLSNEVDGFVYAALVHTRDNVTAARLRARSQSR